MRKFWILAVIFAAGCAGGSPTELALPTVDQLPTSTPLVVASGNAVNSTLTAERRMEFWQFEGRAGDNVTLSTDLSTLNLIVTGPSGEAVAEGHPLDIVLRETGTHTVEVQLLGEDRASYQLTFANDPPTETPTPSPEVTVGIPVPTSAPFEQLGPVTGTLTRSGPIFGAFNEGETTHLYTFQGQAGGYISVQMRRTSGTVDPYLTLHKPDGGAIAVDDNNGGGRTAFLQNVRLPESGIYGVFVSGGGFTGTYDLEFNAPSNDPVPVTPVPEGTEPPPTPEPLVLTPTAIPYVVGRPLQPLVPVRASIARPGGINRHSISLSFGDRITFGVRPDGGQLPLVELYSPSGAVVATADQPGPDGELVITDLEASTTGTHVVFVTAPDSGGVEYTISYGAETVREEVRRGEAAAGTLYTTEVTRQAVRDVWFLRLNNGDMVSVSAGGEIGGYMPLLTFLSPQGEPMIRGPQIASIRAEQDGVYQVQVQPESPGQTGTYTLVWRYIEAAPTAAPPVETVGVLSIDDTLPENAYVFFPFQGQAGDEIILTADAQPGSGLDPELALLDPDDNVIAEDSDSGGSLNARLNLPLPVDGTYKIRLNDYQRNAGDFDVNLRRVVR